MLTRSEAVGVESPGSETRMGLMPARPKPKGRLAGPFCVAGFAGLFGAEAPAVVHRPRSSLGSSGSYLLSASSARAICAAPFAFKSGNLRWTAATIARPMSPWLSAWAMTSRPGYGRVGSMSWP